MSVPMSAARAASGAARPPDSVQPHPCPFRSGTPPGELWAPGGAPPDGFAFMGAIPTTHCWMMPCPCCCEGWTAIVPDRSPYGYRLGHEGGCSAGCAPAEVSWWHLWRLGQIPPREPAPADERARRYAAACVRRTLEQLPDRPSAEQLRRAAMEGGRWVEAGGLDAAPLARALLAAAGRAGHPTTIAQELAAALSAGRARPGRIPA